MLRHLLPTGNNAPEPVDKPRHLSLVGSPSAGSCENSLNVLQGVVIDPLNTFYFKVDSDAMEQFGIRKGMLVVVDRSEQPIGGMIVVARQKGEWLLRQLISHVDRQYLSTGKEHGPFLEITKAAGIVIWGVVTWTCLPRTEKAEINRL
jgi:DNA polymerase V